MNSEPYFLVDEQLEEFQKELKSLMFEIKHPKLKKKGVVLKSFVRACAGTFMKPDYKISFLPPVKEAHRIEQIVKKIPTGYDIYPIPEPGAEKIEKFKAKAKFREIKLEKVVLASHRELIRDRMTGKYLATAKADNKYIVTEPKLKGRDIKLINKILNMHPKGIKVVWDFLKKEGLSDEEATHIKYYIVNELFAFGKIEPLLHDPEIKTITCDGVGKYIKVKYRGKELRTNFVFKDKEKLENYVYNIARKLGKDISEKEPIVDIVDRKFRVHLILGVRTSSKFVFKRLE